VLIVGAGLAGIAAAVHLQAECPHKRFIVLEGRERSGGTWDLFRYPGVRSDSDMSTLGYSFRPWRGDKAIAEGADILRYLEDTAQTHGVDRHIRFQHQVRSASWSSEDARWTLTVERGPSREPVRLSCHFLFICGGYYRYAQGHMPDFPGIARFAGRVVHPQQWTPDIDPSGQRVVVIGSGATAVTLVPALAQHAAHVTLLQRSPTYVVSVPAQDRWAQVLRRCLPLRVAYRLTRWKNLALSMLVVGLSRRFPERARQWLIHRVRRTVDASRCDVDTHFSPHYPPWEQRLCLVPDGDLFEAINSGRASVLTDHIESFTERGLRLRSGREIEADLVVSATGLEIQLLGDIALTVDGRPIELAKTFNYKGLMFSDLPNLAASFGYTRAPWTLKCELACGYVCRVLRHMDKKGYRQCTPRNHDPAGTRAGKLDFSPGYVLRALKKFPRQGAKAPWRPHQNFVRDLLDLRYGALEDGVLDFKA